MLKKIDKDFYCSAGYYKDNECLKGLCPPLSLCNIVCQNYHRKYPTPEQFKKEYGFNYPDDGAVYVLLHGIKEWAIYEYSVAKRFNESEPVVCACTPWGKPPKKWRP